VPSGFAVHAVDTELVVMRDGEELGVSGAPGIMETVEAIQHPAENLETAVRASLSGVQDYIADETTEPWPGITSQPNADARLVGDTIEMWFGDEQDPVMRLRPMSVR